MHQKDFIRQCGRFLPEAIIAGAALFFFVRELGTFPAAWNDDSLFMIVAREYALGNGYTLPLLDRPWFYPYILQVGPMLIYPSAFFMKILGPSIVAARIPMVLYLCGTTIIFYVLTKKIAGRPSALLATALLVSLSAFVNTGKVVMGEIPGMFFALIALLLLTQKRMSLWQSIACGVCVGIAIITKLPYAFVLGGMGLAWLWALLHKRYPEVRSLTIAGAGALLTFVALSPFLGATDMLFVEIYAWLVGTEDILLTKHALWTQPEFLLRLPFLAYDFLLILATAGFIKLRRSIPNALSITIVTTVILFTAYCFTRSGWYRHLLAAHIVLLPFVPTGARMLFGKNQSMVALSAMILVQAWWQWDHRGSSRSTTDERAAVYIAENFAEKDAIIQSAPAFIHLPRNPHWIFLTNPTLSTRIPPALVTPDEKQRCFTLIREQTPDDLEEGPIPGHVIILPPKDCP